MNPIPTRHFYKNILLALLSACTFFVAASCSKKAAEPVNKEQFVGTWYGYYSNNPTLNKTLVISADTGAADLTIPYTVGVGACARDIKLIVKISGNTIRADIASFRDDCTYKNDISGSGNLTGNTLTWTQTNSRGGTPIVTFTGHK